MARNSILPRCYIYTLLGAAVSDISAVELKPSLLLLLLQLAVHRTFVVDNCPSAPFADEQLHHTELQRHTLVGQPQDPTHVVGERVESGVGVISCCGVPSAAVLLLYVVVVVSCNRGGDRSFTSRLFL